MTYKFKISGSFTWVSTIPLKRQLHLAPLKLTVPGSNVKKYQLVYPIEEQKEVLKKEKEIIVQVQ